MILLTLLPSCRSFLFADDTNILLSHNNLRELINIMNLELINVSSWFKSNKVSLNISKTHFMHFQTTRRNVTLSQNIIIDNIPLNQEEMCNISWHYNRQTFIMGPTHKQCFFLNS